MQAAKDAAALVVTFLFTTDSCLNVAFLQKVSFGVHGQHITNGNELGLENPSSSFRLQPELKH